ncbi:MAG: hypothetical protein ACYTGH_15890 [Planctomycetota bacterium]|jgi:hypothetical protein
MKVLQSTIAVCLLASVAYSADLAESKLGENSISWYTYKANTHLTTESKRSFSHRFEVEGKFTLTSKDDIVAVTKEFSPKSVTSKDGKELLASQPRVDHRKDYSMLLDEEGKLRGKVETPDVDVRENPYTIKEAKLLARVVIAEKRENKEIPNIVNERYLPVYEGLSVRVKNLKMTEKMELIIQLDYRRPSEGTEDPFIEAIQAIDTNGNVLGTGRWNKGTPFDDRGSVYSKFVVPSNQTHQKFRLLIVTKSKNKRETVTLKDIYQK